MLRGSVQHDGLFGVKDDALGTSYDFPYLCNTYLELGVIAPLTAKTSDSIDSTTSTHTQGQVPTQESTGEIPASHTQAGEIAAGLRLELLPKPLPGYETGFAGAGIGNIYVRAKYKWLDVTLGDVYAQYGSGLILRLYEDRALGIDNSLRGGKIVLRPYNGFHLEAIGGKQRVYWNCYDDTAWNFDYRQGAVIGGNIELQIDEWSAAMREHNLRLLWGASYVSKYEPMDTVYASYSPPMIYNLPRWTAAADTRVKLQVHGLTVLAEYAHRANDPSTDNNFSYKEGNAFLLSVSYSRKGLSVLAQMKRSENMSFRSERLRRGTGAMLSYLPAFTTTHTYALAALYPYATQMDGEWAWQGEVRYTAPRKSAFGGKYGTTLVLNASHVRGLDDSHSWRAGNTTYYTDVHLELHKRLSKQWWLNAMYMYETYNMKVVEGHGSLMRSHIFVADAKLQLTPKVGMRAELQYRISHSGEQWVYGLYELSLWQCLTLSVNDMYNIGGENYYNAGLTYLNGGHRLQVGFARQRAGYNCAGGVCRYVPAQKGATINYSWNF